MGETKLMGKAFEAELLKRLLQTANCSNNVSIQTVDKNNDQKRRGIVIRSAGSKVSPVFYLDLMYEKYLDGMTLDQIVEAIWKFYEEDENIRKIACEVLGWYVLSDAAPDIGKELRTIAKTQKKTLPESVRKEIEKTVKRLTNI